MRSSEVGADKALATQSVWITFRNNKARLITWQSRTAGTRDVQIGQYLCHVYSLPTNINDYTSMARKYEDMDQHFSVPFNLLKPTGFGVLQQVEHFKNSTLCPHCVYVIVFIWEKTATCATYSINWLAFITEMESVYSAVRTGYLNEAVCACVTYSINWLVFITEMISVYSAVRTGSLNEAVCACATYSINW
jgi:hypothetical protein